MLKLSEFRKKEVININDGARYGFVEDIEFDEKSGKIIKLIVPCNKKFLKVFGNEQEYHIDWESISQIGGDLILVDIDIKKALKNCER